MSIEIMPLADHEWAVQVQEPGFREVSYHKVRVAPETLVDLGVSDERKLVQESVEIYLEHAQSTSLPHDLTVDWLERNVPGFLEDLTARLG